MAIHLIVLLMVLGLIESKMPERLFCNTLGDHTGKRSCAAALWGRDANFDSCVMWFPRNESEKGKNFPRLDSAECDSVPFEEGGSRDSADLGSVKLRSFHLRDDWNLRSEINVTFSRIKWTSMWMRFNQTRVRLSNFCRKFTISSTTPVPREKKLFYDCSWSKGDMGWKEYEFDFIAHDETSTSATKYLFKVPLESHINPLNNRLNESELFMYIDLTHQPSLKLHLQTVKDRFNISSDNYLVTAHHTTPAGYETVTKLEPALIEEDQITYHYDTNLRKGTYHFAAQINHVNCTKGPGCFVSISPSFIYEGHDDRIVLIAMVGCGGTILAVLSFAFFLWRIRKNSLHARKPTVLMVYTPTTAKHTRTVVEFAKFLTKFCHIEALVDELGIPMTTSKDPPVTWCNDSFSKANAIMVLSSPLVTCIHYESIYRNVDSLCLTLLQEKMADRKSGLKYLTAVLPYCKGNKAGIPDEAKHLQQFVLTQGLTKMLTFLHTGSTSLYHQYCISPLINLGLTEITRKGSDLVKAIREAEEEVKIGVKKCNHCSSADQETGPLIADRFMSIDVMKESADDDIDQLLGPKRESLPVLADTFPGPIENLNLLGTEGTDVAHNSSNKKSISGGFNLNKLNLG